MSKKGIITIIIVIALIVCAVLFIGGNKQKNEPTQESSSDPVKEGITINDFKDNLNNKGLNVTKETKKMGEMIGATEGCGYEINGKSVEVYKFDEKSTETLTVNNIEMAKTSGKIKMPDLNMEFKAIYNKGLVLINYEGHPNEKEIVEVFNNL